MKKIVLILCTILGILILSIGVIGLILPKEYGLERAIMINAPAETVFPYVNNLVKRTQWSPWEREDPSMKIEYGDIKEGVGAFCKWESKKSGNGSMLITQSIPFSSVAVDLNFEGLGSAKALWSFESKENGTKIIWGFSAEAHNFGTKIFGSMINLFLGPHYEKGLNNLKELVEQSQKQPSS